MKKMYKLENGINLLAIEDKNAKLTSFRVGIKVGSIDENNTNYGVSHFLEHLLFTGTKKRSEKEIDKELSIYAGNFNAYTFINRTIYLSDMLTCDFENAVELFSDMIINSTISEESVNKERVVILSEIDMNKDDCEYSEWVTIYEEVFKGQSIASPVIGYRDIIENISTEEIRNHYNRYYVPENTCISVISSLSPDEVYKIISKYFGTWKQGIVDIPKRNKIEDIIEPIEKEIYVGAKNQEAVYMLFNITGLSPREIAMSTLLLKRLGDSTTSLMWRKLRTELGLSYSVFATAEKIENLSSYCAYANASPENTDLVLETMNECILKIKTKEGILEDLEVARKEVIFDMASGAENNSAMNSVYVTRMINNVKIEFYDEYIEVIKTCTIDELLELSNKIFKHPCIIISKADK